MPEPMFAVRKVVAFQARRGPGIESALDQRLRRAGLAVATVVVEAVAVDDTCDVHMPTVLVVCAHLAAEAALQAAVVASRQPLATRPGGWILGGPADHILFAAAAAFERSATIWAPIAAAGEERGVQRSGMPDLKQIVAMAETALGSKPFPVYTVAAHALPRGIPRATAARLRHTIHGLAADEGLCTPHEQALACSHAVAEVIRRESEPAVLLQLAAEALISAARQTPLPFAAG
jgi:hypothetical protein